MPKRRECQLSGAKKRRLAKVKADQERSTVTTAQRLDRFLVHSKLSVTRTETTESENENVTVATTSAAATSQNECESESDKYQYHRQLHTMSDSDHCEAISEDDQAPKSVPSGNRVQRVGE